MQQMSTKSSCATGGWTDLRPIAPYCGAINFVQVSLSPKTLPMGPNVRRPCCPPFSRSACGFKVKALSLPGPRAPAMPAGTTRAWDDASSPPVYGEMKNTGCPPLPTVIELLLDAICVLDADGNYLYVSAAYERIFGYAPE